MALTGHNLGAIFKKHPVAITCGMLSVLLLAGTFYRGKKVSEQTILQQQKEEEGRRILNNIRFAANLPEQYEDLIKQTRQLESRLVRGSDMALNLQYFYRIITESGVTRLDVRQLAGGASGQQRGPKPLYPSVAFTASVKGGYRQVLDFIGRIESGAHFYRLSSCSVLRAGSEGGTAGAAPLTLTLNLELLGSP